MEIVNIKTTRMYVLHVCLHMKSVLICSTTYTRNKDSLYSHLDLSSTIKCVFKTISNYFLPLVKIWPHCARGGGQSKEALGPTLSMAWDTLVMFFLCRTITSTPGMVGMPMAPFQQFLSELMYVHMYVLMSMAFVRGDNDSDNFESLQKRIIIIKN
jgi:hypothetical protein